MKIFNRLLKSIVCFVCILGIIGFVNTPKSLADKCGKKDRVYLPSCVYEQSKYPGEIVKNNCDYEVTIKYDRKGSDDRLNLKTGESKEWRENGLASCCPRYNSCGDSTEQPLWYQLNN